MNRLLLNYIQASRHCHFWHFLAGDKFSFCVLARHSAPSHNSVANLLCRNKNALMILLNTYDGGHEYVWTMNVSVCIRQCVYKCVYGVMYAGVCYLYCIFLSMRACMKGVHWIGPEMAIYISMEAKRSLSGKKVSPGPFRCYRSHHPSLSRLARSIFSLASS